MLTLIKSTVRLLMRSKGFLFFLLVTPIVSTLLLTLNTDSELLKEHSTAEIVELSESGSRAVYAADTASFVVKVYDGCRSQLSEYALNKLASNGLFSVCRKDVRSTSQQDVTAQIKKDGFEDRAGVIVFIKSGFDSAVINDRLADGIELFISSDDSRRQLFENELNDILANIHRASDICGGDPERIAAMLDSYDKSQPVMNISEIARKDKIVLNDTQTNSAVQIGYAFVSITLGFIVIGAFVANTVIKEEHNKVFTRLLLSGRGTAFYFVSKFLVLTILSLILTLILGICLMFVSGLHLGMPMPVFLIIIFILGVILGSVCMLTGILFDDIMSTYYATFALWCISSMMSGMIFPLENSSDMIKKLSGIMPQKWFMEISKRLISGNSDNAASMIFCVAAAYLIIILSVGSVCLKIKKQQP